MKLKPKYYISIIALILATFYYFFFYSERTELDKNTVASVNGIPIKLSDFQQRVLELKLDQAINTYSSMKDLKARALRQLIIEAIIISEAKKNNIIVTNEELNRQIKNIRNSYTEEEFQELMNSLSTNYEDWTKQVKKTLLVEKTLANEITNKISISEAEIKERFDTEYKDKITEPRVKLLQILSSSKENAQKIMEEIKNGESFEELARKYSEAPEAVNGGLLGYIKKGEGIEIFDKAFDMKSGDISDIYESPYGFHILMVQDKIPAYQATIDDVKETITNEIATEKEKELYEKWLEKKLKSAKILKNSSVFDTVR